MEKDLFPLREQGGEGMRDLPPLTPTPMPRMENLMENLTEGNSCGCGCGCDGGHDHGHTDGHCGGCAGHEGCGADSWGLSEYPLAMVYAPCQTFRGLYDPTTALGRGTLFSELDLPLGGHEGGGLTTEGRGCGCRHGGERRRV